MINIFEMPGLADKINEALAFQRHAKGLPPSRVSLDASELSYIASCISYFVSDQMLRRAEKLPAAGLPTITALEKSRPGMALNARGWTFMDPVGRVKQGEELRLYRPDTLPSETEQS